LTNRGFFTEWRQKKVKWRFSMRRVATLIDLEFLCEKKLYYIKPRSVRSKHSVTLGILRRLISFFFCNSKLRRRKRDSLCRFICTKLKISFYTRQREMSVFVCCSREEESCVKVLLAKAYFTLLIASLGRAKYTHRIK
jgi:hypothetical protein